VDVKVCFLTSNHLPEAGGGTEQVVAALEREFRGQGVEVVAITSSDIPHSGTDVLREEHEGVVIHRIFKLADEWDHQGFVRPRILDIVRRLLEQERPDVLHVHSSASLGTGCIAVARQLGIPVAMTFHDLWVTCARYFRLPMPGITCPTGLDRSACVECVAQELQMDHDRVEHALAERDRLVRQDLALVDACTAPSVTAAAIVRECAPLSADIEIIPHGLLQPVAALDRAAARAAGEAVRVGTFGGLGPEKGMIELIGALAGLPCEVRLAGRHYSRQVAEAVAGLQQSGTSVVYGGEYGPADPHPARFLHLAVFPSKCQETYGLVVDEALARGVPCVVSDSGALAERQGQPGVVVTSLANLPGILHDLVTAPERIDALRAAIPARLPTISAAAARYLDLYRAIA